MSNFVVYKSSAGSGKTFTLVKEYLRLALLEDKKIGFNYKRILAVTFTNKAAAEMKQRVIDALNQISNSPTLPFVGELLCEELKISDTELRNRSQFSVIQCLLLSLHISVSDDRILFYIMSLTYRGRRHSRPGSAAY